MNSFEDAFNELEKRQDTLKYDLLELLRTDPEFLDKIQKLVCPNGNVR